MSFAESPSRRVMLAQAAAAFGVGLTAGPDRSAFAQQTGRAATPACHDGDGPTKPDIEGPYYKPRSPLRAQLVEPKTRGQLYRLEGHVLTRTCEPVPSAVLDLWHADENGSYDESGYRYRGHLFTDKTGRYSFDTIMPGLYPGRTRHYHFKVAAPFGRVLTTQLYFPNEPRNRMDDYYSPALLMHVAKGTAATVARFDFILDIL
jgi:protocatechuate 3,4-dioxygenase beta subunit